jgi:hypothetical protein
MLNATHNPKNAKNHANKENQAASTKITATSIAQHQNQNAMLVPVNAKTAIPQKIQTAHN